MMPEKFNKKIMLLFQCVLIVLTLTGCVSQASRFGIIFTSGQFGSLDIFRIPDNTQNNAVEQLTYTPTVGEYNLLVSKNGNQIVFEVGSTSLMEDSSESKMEEYQHIYLLDATDKTFVDITKTLVGYETVWRNFSMDWFPNQNQFVFIANEVVDSEIKSFIKFVDVDKGSRNDIVISMTDEIPSAFNSVKWSPDGRKLLLTRGVVGGAQQLQNPGSAILVYDLEGKITTQITNMKDQCLPKGWSPTTKQIVATCSLSVPYVEGVSMSETVRVFNVENPDQSNELLTFSNCYDPSWSSDGSQIVFVCDKGENQNCPFAEIKTTFANFCLKSRFLPLISLNLAKNRHRFPHSRLPSRTRYEATPKYGTIGSSSPVFGGKTIRDFKNFSANGQSKGAFCRKF
jgi:hypothetical protein